jgi:hypothetical protein
MKKTMLENTEISITPNSLFNFDCKLKNAEIFFISL